MEIARDFQRDVYCLFGLPVDNLTLAQAKALIRARVTEKKSMVLATININWVVRSFTDPVFRAAVLNSDLVTIDGKPLLWLARLLGYPLQETVPGSTLIQQLRDEPADQPLTIFLFGGEGNAAERAMTELNIRQGGLRPVGAINPGFGSVEEMSTEQIINAINSTKPDILLVALGAAKGVAWIEKNRHLLHAGVISHLGATINFLGGTVKRAPQFMQECGLEWVWRIFQEPKLFVRYAADGLKLGWSLVRLFPLCLSYRFRQGTTQNCPRGAGDETGTWQEDKDTVTLFLAKCLRPGNSPSLRELFNRAATARKNIRVDLHNTTEVDGAFGGLLLLLEKHQRRTDRRLDIAHLAGKPAQSFQLCGLKVNPSDGRL